MSNMTFVTPKYPPPAVTSVIEMLDPSRPLQKSTLPLTAPIAPKFADPREAEIRHKHRLEKKKVEEDHTSRIYTQRLNERKFLKAQYEFDREKKLAEQTIYKKEKSEEWKSRFVNSPFLVDLVADSERIEEEMNVRNAEDKRRKKRQEERKKKVKNEIIIKALSETTQLEAARAMKRDQIALEKVKKAKDRVDQVEEKFEQRKKDQEDIEKHRSDKLETLALHSRDTRPF